MTKNVLRTLLFAIVIFGDAVYSQDAFPYSTMSISDWVKISECFSNSKDQATICSRRNECYNKRPSILFSTAQECGDKLSNVTYKTCETGGPLYPDKETYSQLLECEIPLVSGKYTVDDIIKQLDFEGCFKQLYAEICFGAPDVSS